MTKDEIRLKMRAARRSLTKEFIIDASRAIQSSLLSLGCIRSAGTVMMYMSAFNEPKTDTLLAELTDSGKRIAVPVSNKTDHTITPSVVSGSFVKGEYGICEPDVLQPITANEIDVVENDRIRSENNTIYTLTGQRVTNPGKGIYIQNGKKIIIR